MLHRNNKPAITNEKGRGETRPLYLPVSFAYHFTFFDFLTATFFVAAAVATAFAALAFLAFGSAGCSAGLSVPLYRCPSTSRGMQTEQEQKAVSSALAWARTNAISTTKIIA
jgi:hypothetical protein